MRPVFVLLYLLSSLVLGASISSRHPKPWNDACIRDAPRAETRNGTVCGIYLPSFDQEAFLGVPFAQPPVNDLRLRHPIAYNRKYDLYNATKQPPSCPGYAGFDVGIGPLSEDCLYLNVIRPKLLSPGTYALPRKLPVLVWIYGGGFDAGGVADARYNMSYLVAQSVRMGKPIIGISINYRVGGWGFLASREVLADDAANIGLWDQRLALEFIQENIAGFGGDPEKVTIWGESAGAFSVGYHTVAFDGQHMSLFRGVILESGTALGSNMQNSTQLSESGGFQDMYDNVTVTVGCRDAINTLQCLRGVPYEVLFKAFEAQVYTPIVDGVMIRRLPSESFKKGLVAPVAALIGSNTDEGTASFWGPRGTLNTTEDVRRFIKSLNGGGLSDKQVNEVLVLYPDDPAQGCPFGTGQERFSDQGWMYKRGAAIAGDIFVHAGRRATTEYFAKQGLEKDLPVYSYRFDQPPWDGIEDLIATVAPVYSTHYTELVYVFNNPSRNISNWIGPDASYHALSNLMSRLWIGFAYSLNPNDCGLQAAPYWPKYTLEEPKNMVFQAEGFQRGTFVENDNWRAKQLRWWNAHWDSLRS